MNRVLPILFNTDMVKALLDGRKTVTRRIMKPQPLFYTGRKYIFADNECPPKWQCCDNIIDTYQYQAGDILYVRETWCKGSLDYKEEQYYYKADDNKLPCKWHPSIHMPKEAARIWLKVTDVRIERLQDIDDNGILKEGLEIGCPFEDIWDSTVKKPDRKRHSWETNPWVWVIGFERCGKPASEVGK